MYSLLFLGFVSCVLSVLLTPLVRNLALRLGMVDKPDRQRKIHAVPVPRLGGVAIFIAAVGAYGLLLLVGFNGREIIWSAAPFALRLLPAVVVIFLTGLIDDLHGIRPWQKLSGQVLAAALACLGGIHVTAIGDHPFSTGIGVAVTLLWLVGCTNAVNLIDGVDGLAAGVGLFAAITTLTAALLNGNLNLALAIVPFAGALLGFLRFNFNPASIFLGDCGSLTLGFLLGCYGAAWSTKATTLLGVTAPLIALSVPLFDAGIAILRRFLRQQPIFGADRAHIHHKLLAQGLSPRRVALILYGTSGIAAAASLLLTIGRQQYHGFVIVLFCLAAWLGLQHLGYSEFHVARKLVLAGAFRGMLNAQLALTAFEEEFARAATLEQCYEVLQRAYPKFGFGAMIFNLDGVTRYAGAAGGWTVRVDFSGHGYINLKRDTASGIPGAVAIPFIDCISRITVQKLERLEPQNVDLTRSAYAD